MEKKLTEKVAFDFIRYANCWEDADILLQGLNPAPDSKILSVGSAGDNSFSLLTTNPKIVVAVDVNKIQLYLIELKKTTIQQLSYEEVLQFFGFRHSDNRDAVFNKIKNQLSDETRIYWEHHIEQLKQGIISQGKFENYFRLFSGKILPWIHSKSTTEKLLSPKNAVSQKEFYEKHWNTWRWRLLFKLFFSKYVMGKYGRDPEFLREVKVPVGQFIFEKAGKHLQSVQAQNNFILRYNLTGSFGDLLPHYLQPDNFTKVKAHLDKFHIMEGYAEDAIKKYGTFNAMNLSNIFEYMNPELFEKTAKELIAATEPGGKLGYWNLMVTRRISGIVPDKIVFEETLSQELTAIDKGFFYSRFIIDKVK